MVMRLAADRIRTEPEAGGLCQYGQRPVSAIIDIQVDLKTKAQIFEVRGGPYHGGVPLSLYHGSRWLKTKIAVLLSERFAKGANPLPT